ncbi:NADPH-dependent FMN reductase [Segetibacter koreensis]|uniref:NADPH-dependent FMN reductase n=1 Tax=Segetibacter koreensis TaxID=398037 RepID=UPI000374FF16|nr:NAD(P)H-dependent oxidoreductase [Segetibacter koreensis]
MAAHLHFVGISGSLRKDSWNTMLLKSCFSLLPSDVTMEVASIGDLPLYNADNDLPAVEQRPLPVKQFRDILSKADGIVIVSPEYNYSIPGGLKNAIDWASRGTDSPLLNKVVALMGATPGLWGTNKMQVAFHPVFQFLNIRSVYKPEVLVNQANKKFDDNGILIDEMTKDVVKKQLEALKALIFQLRGEKIQG